MRVQNGQGTHPDGPQLASIATKHGTVEYASLGDGPTVLSLHGAAGGYDQGLILARTIGGPGFRFLIARSATLVRLMRARTERDLNRGQYRGITDPAIRARTLQDPETGPLLRELTLGMFDRLAERMAGTFNDIEQARRLPDFPFERIGAPTLIVHGTQDPLVPYVQAMTLAARIPGAEILALDEGEHAVVFTHRDEIRRRVTGFLTAHTPPTA